MPTVPNWIAKGYAYSPAYEWREARAYKIATWRATRTLVVVTLEGLPGEFRFRLDDLRYAIRSNEKLRRMVLIPPDDSRVSIARAASVGVRAVDMLQETIRETRLDPASMGTEALVQAIDRIRVAAARAMAELTEVL